MKYSTDFTDSAPRDYAARPSELSPLFRDLIGAVGLVVLVFINVFMILGL